MRFIHISDLHIGKQLHHYNIIKEQEHILDQIVELAKQEVAQKGLSAILICGDIYDKSVPSAEAVSVFDSFLTKLNQIRPSIPLFIIAGNHDSGERLDYGRNILCQNNVYFAGLPPKAPEEFLQKVTLADAFGEVDFYLFPFLKPFFVRNTIPQEENMTYEKAFSKMLEREEIDFTRRNVLLSHQFFVANGKEPQTSDSEIKMLGGVDSIPTSVIADFDYVALGHIHKPQPMGSQTIRYCGTPLAYSLSEQGQEKSVTVVELKEKGEKVQVDTLPLIPLHQVYSLKGTLEEILKEATKGDKTREAKDIRKQIAVKGLNEEINEEINEDIKVSRKDNRIKDYVSVTLTDEIDPYRPKERLEEVFSHLLEVRLDNARTRELLSFEEKEITLQEPFEVFSDFFADMMRRDMIEEEEAYIKQVINEIKES